jgi:TrmH family RNA methyltransferase
MEPIRSLDNPGIRRLSRLLESARERRELGLAVAEGPHLLSEALTAGRLSELWATPEAMESAEAAGLLGRAAQAGVKPRPLSPGLLKRLCQLPAPQGWLSVFSLQAQDWPRVASLCLALDGVQDPGNLGTLLRSAWAVGAALILGPGCADPWSPKVLRAGVGAQFHVPLQAVEDLVGRLSQLKQQGLQVLAAAPRSGMDLWQCDLRRPTCLVLGAEGPGLSPAVRVACDGSVELRYPGSAESLNVAVSGSLLLFEALRQREKSSK